MAKANLILSTGTKVQIEGTVEEVAALLAKFSGSTNPKSAEPEQKSKYQNFKKSENKSQPGPTGLMLDLINEGYFKARRSLPDIQKKLEEKGHIYAQTSLSPILIRLVRRKDVRFRRIRDNKGWIYVG